MKFKIEYEYDPDYTLPYWARAYFRERRLLQCGRTFEEAREALLKQLCQLSGNPTEVTTPEPEEIEV